MNDKEMLYTVEQEELLELEESKEQGIRDLAMRSRQIQHEIMCLQAMLAKKTEEYCNVSDDLIEEVNFSKRTFRWKDCPRYDLDNMPNVIVGTGNNSMQQYFLSEFKHIEDGVRWMDYSKIDPNNKRAYSMLHWINMANELKAPAFLVSYKWMTRFGGRVDNPVFFVEPLNDYAGDAIERSGLEYPKYDGVLSNAKSGNVYKSKKALALSEREYVLFEYFLRSKTKDRHIEQVMSNWMLSDEKPDMRSVFRYWNLDYDDYE